MDDRPTNGQRIGAPTVPLKFAITVLVICAITLWILDARARDFGTIASALGLYSAGLLGVFSVLNGWRSSITKRRIRYQNIENRWRIVVDRAVKFSLIGSALAFALMLFGVIAPAVKLQVSMIVEASIYSFIARLVSVVAITGVVALGMMSLQIVRDVNAVYDWNNHVEEEDNSVEEQRAMINQRKSV
ncbi:hypothetical protein [Arcanobacterium phocae]|uniref:hypothetical protein n=1 Tax=Arcanobacterium phocae TaxID=131112 RepID=UPI001C0EE40A|nr:hypothetical protein [Arcanobacterium phocae]